MSEPQPEQASSSCCCCCTRISEFIERAGHGGPHSDDLYRRDASANCDWCRTLAMLAVQRAQDALEGGGKVDLVAIAKAATLVGRDSRYWLELQATKLRDVARSTAKAGDRVRADLARKAASVIDAAVRANDAAVRAAMPWWSRWTWWLSV